MYQVELTQTTFIPTNIVLLMSHWYLDNLQCKHTSRQYASTCRTVRRL